MNLYRRERKKTACTYLAYTDENGKQVRNPKKKFKVFEDAVKAAKRKNESPNVFSKYVAYKCSECLLFHIGSK